MTTVRENHPPVPRRQRRRPLGWAAILMAVAVFLAASALRQISLGGEAARKAISRNIEDLTGLPVTLGGKAEFRLLPAPRLSVDDVVIGSDLEGPRLTVAHLTADLDLFQALLGRTEIDRLVLVSPELSAPPGAAPDASMPDAFGPFLSRLQGLGDLDIRDGVLSRGGKGSPAIVSAANLRLSWPDGGSAASLSGTYSWNGQPVRLGLSVAAPLAWLDGKASTIDLDVTSPQLDLSFDGEASAAGRLSGRVQANLPSPARTLRWLVAPRAAVPEIGPLSIAADLTSEDGRLNLADAKVSIDGFAGRGALDVVVSEGRRPSLGGTLAFERLDLDGIANALAPLPGTPFEWARPIPLGFVDRLDIDLRVSAGQGRIGALALTDLAGTVKLKDGTATLDIGDAGLLGGNGQMRVSVNTEVSPPALKGSASIRGVDAGGLLAAFGLPSNTLSGAADVSVSVEAPATSWADIFDRHHMEASLSARSGQLAGLDPRHLRTTGKARFDQGEATASLPFSSLRAEIATLGPRMALTSLRIVGEAGTVEGAGLLLDASSEADLEGSFEPAAAETGSAGQTTAALTKQKPFTLTMRGSWPHPAIVTSAPDGEE